MRKTVKRLLLVLKEVIKQQNVYDIKHTYEERREAQNYKVKVKDKTVRRDYR